MQANMLFADCLANHGVAPPIDCLQHIHHLIPHLECVLAIFWKAGQQSYGITQGVGEHPWETPNTWHFDSHGVKQWSRIDFNRPAADWMNWQWDEVARHMPSILPARLADCNATLPASWMEAIVGTVYQLCTGARQLRSKNQSLGIRSKSTSVFGELARNWYAMITLGIPMPGIPLWEDVLLASFWQDVRLRALPQQVEWVCTDIWPVSV